MIENTTPCFFQAIQSVSQKLMWRWHFCCSPNFLGHCYGIGRVFHPLVDEWRSKMLKYDQSSISTFHHLSYQTQTLMCIKWISAEIHSTFYPDDVCALKCFPIADWINIAQSARWILLDEQIQSHDHLVALFPSSRVSEKWSGLEEICRHDQQRGQESISYLWNQ